MELVFNEISAEELAASTEAARERMQGLLNIARRAKPHGFNKIPVGYGFFEIVLAQGYQVRDWLNDVHVRQDHKTLLMGLRRQPYIPEENEELVNTFLLAEDYYLDEPCVAQGRSVEGLAVACIQNTIAVSFPSAPVWDNVQIRLCDQSKNQRTVRHISVEEHFHEHVSWLDFLRKPSLVRSGTPPDGKPVHLRDDHGKDLLLKFSKQLVHSPYVEGVINSLPFNPKHKMFIKKITDDGKIEMVLHRKDKGYGLVVQSTGRNGRETARIAEELEERFYRRYKD